MGPLDEIAEVTSDLEIEIRVVERATEVHSIARGIDVMKEGDLYRETLKRFDTLLGPLEELLGKWAKPKLGEVRVKALREKHPPHSPYWWEYWAEVIGETPPAYLRRGGASPLV